MKKTIFVSVVIAVVGFATWVWFIEFGGWDRLFEYSGRSPRLRRIKTLLDHPITYYRWRSTMKIFDPFYFNYWYRPNQLKTYDMIIARRDLDELNANLPQQYSRGGLPKDSRIKVKGELVSQDTKKMIKASYHGNSFNHWSERKKSWKLEFDTGEEQYLILPSDRGYFSESLSNYRAKKLGLLSQYDDWVWLRINGEDIGVYYVSGGWNEYWLTKSGRQISQLVGELDYQTGNVIFPIVWDGVWNWKFYAYRANRKFPNSYYLQQLLDAVNNHTGDGFAKTVSQIMDIDSLARWKSLSIIMNSYHTDDVHNWRMWLNPETLRFEMIPLDRFISLNDRHPTGWPFILDGGIDKLSSRIHSSPELSLAIDQILWEYVKDDKQLEDDLRYWDDLTKRLLPQMYADKNTHAGNISLRRVPLMRQKIVSQYQNIRTYLTIEDLHLKIDDSGGKPMLVISSFQPTQAELQSVTVNGQKVNFDKKLLFSLQVTAREGEVFIFDRLPGEIKIPITCPGNCRIKVAARNLVTGNYQEVSL